MKCAKGRGKKFFPSSRHDCNQDQPNQTSTVKQKNNQTKQKSTAKHKQFICPVGTRTVQWAPERIDRPAVGGAQSANRFNENDFHCANFFMQRKKFHANKVWTSFAQRGSGGNVSHRRGVFRPRRGLKTPRLKKLTQALWEGGWRDAPHHIFSG